jgi:hypothetical protein
MEDRLLLANYMLIDPASLVEGSGGGLASMNFTVRLMNPAAGDVLVDYGTAGLTASSGVDFVATSGTLVIPAGQQAATITVPIVRDNMVEAHEGVSMNLSAPRNAVLMRASTTGMILDDDKAVTPEVTVSDQSITRGLSGWKLLNFQVTLNTSVDNTVTMKATTANITALAGSDYEAKTEVLTFAPGETTKTFSVKIYGTSVASSTKLFTVRLTDSTVAIKKAIGYGSLRYGA